MWAKICKARYGCWDQNAPSYEHDLYKIFYGISFLGILCQQSWQFLLFSRGNYYLRGSSGIIMLVNCCLMHDKYYIDYSDQNGENGKPLGDIGG